MFATLALAGCTSRPAASPDPTPADFMEQAAQVFTAEAASRQELADRWREGDRLIADAKREQRDADKAIRSAERVIKQTQRQIKKQQDRLAKAQKTLADANNAKTTSAAKLQEGQNLKADAEARFRAAYPDSPLR